MSAPPLNFTTSQELIAPKSRHRQDLLDFLDSVDHVVIPVVAPATTCVPPSSSLAALSSTTKDKLTKLRNSVKEKEALIEHLTAKRTAITERCHSEIERLENDALARQESEQHAQEEVVRRALEHTSTLMETKETLVKELQHRKDEAEELLNVNAAELKALEEQHQQALFHLKGQWAVEEKQRRECWKKQQTDKIRDSTFKSLEPDIAIIMSKHKSELQRLEHEHAENMRRRSEAVCEKERRVSQLQQILARECDDAVAKERELGQMQIATHAARCEGTAHEHFSSIVRREHEFEEQMQKEVDNLKTALVNERAELGQAQRERAEALHKQEIHQQRIAAENERIRAERIAEKRRAQERSHAVALTVESERLRAHAEGELRVLAAKLRQQVEEELRNVRRALETEHAKRVAERSEVSAKLEDDLKRIEHEKEILEGELHHAQDSVTRREGNLRILHRELLTLTSEIAQRRLENDRTMLLEKRQLEKECNEVDTQWKEAIQSAKKEYENALAQKEAQLQGAKERRQQELAQLRDQHAATMHTLEERIRSTLTQKEHHISDLRATVEQAKARATRAEKIIFEHQKLLE